MKSFKDYRENQEQHSDEAVENYISWHSKFERKFPMGEYNRSRAWESDRYCLVVGRIHNVLDYFGETQDLDRYVGNLRSAEKSYLQLLGRYVQTYHPEMYDMWRQEYL